MGCRILLDKSGEMACFYDSTTMTAFGPVTNPDDLDTFEKWLEVDPRTVDIFAEWEAYQDGEKLI